MKGTSRPIVSPNDSRDRVCWRCGITFRWKNMHLIEGAPCRDCREVLADQGDTRQWGDRTVAQRAA